MFDEQTKNLLSDAHENNFTKEEIVVLASLIEGEAHGESDREMIAGILLNRLKKNMRLQVDVSQYTYEHGGLPPKPIGNPGLASIKAALHPAKTSYLYYIHDSRGTIHYATTFAEHQANIKKYLK